MGIKRIKSWRGIPTSRNVSWFASGLVIFSVCGCAYTGYNQAVQSGVETIPCVTEFNELFPGSDNFISYYTGQAGTPMWNSKAGLFGRYVLSLQISITLDETRTKIAAYGEPKFYLREIREIDDSGISYGDTHMRFGKEEWKKIVETKGDLSTLGVPIIKDAPIPGFDKGWKRA